MGLGANIIERGQGLGANIIERGHELVEMLEKHGTDFSIKQDTDRIIANEEMIKEASDIIGKPVNEIIIKAAQENVEVELEVVYDNGESFKFAKF